MVSGVVEQNTLTNILIYIHKFDDDDEISHKAFFPDDDYCLQKLYQLNLSGGGGHCLKNNILCAIVYSERQGEDF